MSTKKERVHLKLSKSFIQSIGILVMLAELPEGVTLKSHEISKRMDVSHTYLIKIAKKLKDQGIILSISSKNGGYSLNRPLEEISFWDIYEAVEPQKNFLDGVNFEPIYSIFLSKDIIMEQGQVFRSIVSEAETGFKEILAQHFLSEVMPKDEDGKPLKIDWTKMIDEN